MNNESKIFGSFFLDDSEFALNVTHVQEVVNSPDKFTSVPLAPPYLKGLFNLRGCIIPVMDLRMLLKLSPMTHEISQKIAIVEMDGCCVGLLFDRTGEIFRSHEEERNDFNDESNSSVISGVFKKNEGKRIIQILDATRLFKLQNIPKDAARNRLDRDHLRRKRGLRKQCISFKVGPAKCALAISDIQEILKFEKLNDSSLTTGNCIGVLDLRGTTVPVIDFAALLKYRDLENRDSADRRIVVMKLENELFGLMVDNVDNIVSYYPDELIAFPLVEQNRIEMFIGCITGHGDQDILLLNHQKILFHNEINEITHGHSKLFKNRTAEQNEKKSKGGPRKTYVTFTVGTSYAVGIHEVKEIIEYPKTLLQPPGLPQHVKGVLNLRGQLVTIIDARFMYSYKSEESQPVQQKVLIFNQEGLHFGFVVDSVESLVTCAENDKIKLPEILYKSPVNGMTDDVSEAVEVTDNKGDKKNLLIVCASSIANRAKKSLAAAA